MAAENTRIVQRGLVLLIVMTAIAVVVLVALLQRSGPSGTPVQSGANEAAAILAITPAAFPASLSWAGLYQLGETLPSAPGWEIRYTATRVLARNGSAGLPVDVLCEMLDEQRQLRNFQARLNDGRIVPDEGAAAEEVVIALKAVSEWHKAAPKSPGTAVEKLTGAVEKLTHSRNNVVRTRAQETLLALANK
jgi:hypothetical protein